MAEAASKATRSKAERECVRLRVEKSMVLVLQGLLCAAVSRSGLMQ